MKKIYLLAAAIIASYIVAILVSITDIPQKRDYIQQNIKLSELESIVKVEAPEPTVLIDLPITHINGATTSFRIITFATPTMVGGFYSPKDGSLSVRVYNWGSKKGIDGVTRNVPLVDISVLVHELVHMTTWYNAQYKDCPSLWESVCQERMAYDAGYYYQQLRAYEEDGKFILTKD